MDTPAAKPNSRFTAATPGRAMLLALAVLLGVGGLSQPLGQALRQQLQQQALLNPPVDMGLRGNLGQMGFAAALGGLRSLVASVTYLQAYRAWELVAWARVDSLMALTCTLQPKHANYWDEAAWHMAYNAASHYLYNESIEPWVRGRLSEQYKAQGVAILKTGLSHLPQNAKLWHTLAEIYQNRTHEPKLAAQAWLKVRDLTGQARYARFAAYQLAQSQEASDWKTAYAMLRQAYARADQRTPSLIENLRQLEQRLNIPYPQRIPEAAPTLEKDPAEFGPIR